MRARELDRISPTKRPQGRNSGTQSWRDLLFVHWAFPVAAVRAVVPPSLELDPWDDEMLVGVVPFAMQRVRSAWMPPGTGLTFLETNLRTYVHHRGRPGVYFFSLEAASWLAVKVARVGWSLPYHHASMSTVRTADHVVYRSERKGDPARTGLEVEYEIQDKLGVSEPGSLEHFLLERYLLFSERREQLLMGQVHHAPYPVHRARVLSLSESLCQATGLPAPGAVRHAHFSPGVDVEVFGPHPVAASPAERESPPREAEPRAGRASPP